MTKYYDITESGSNIIWFFGIGLAVLIGCIVIWIRFIIKGGAAADKRKIGFLSLIPFIWTMVIWMSSARHYFAAKTALKEHTYEVVEGRVEHFSPIPPGDHGDESFSVKGVPFKYSESKIDFGFKQSRINGSPVYQGKLVKIHYYEGRILRLWVCDTCPFNPEGVEWK